MCSVSCGGGLRHRDVYCAEVISGNLTKVSCKWRQDENKKSLQRPHRKILRSFLRP